MFSTRPDDPSNRRPPLPPDTPSRTGDPPRPDRGATWITVVGSVLGTLISTMGAVYVAILASPDKAVDVVEQVSGEKAVASRTVTAVQTLTADATTTVTITAQPTSTGPGSTESGGTEQGGTGSSFAGDTLKVADSVARQDCKPPSGGAHYWRDESVAFAGAEQEFTAILCRMTEPKAVVGYLDYTVPDAATKLTARVGIGRNSPNTSTRMEFAVLDLDGAVLTTKTVGYRQPGDIEAAVAGKQRVRLRVKLVESDGKLTGSNYVLAAWTDTRFS